MKFDILGFGACSVDDVLYVDEFPQPDGKTRVQERHRFGGGLAGTALVAASRLGASAAWCGVLGDDELSHFSRDELVREGVDISAVQFVTEARPHYSVVIVEKGSGSRSILACRDGVTPFPPAEITHELISSCRLLFVDHTAVETSLRAAALARELGVPVVADIERVDIPRLGELLTSIDHLIVSVETARKLSGKPNPKRACSALIGYGASCVALTNGEHGCWFAERGGEVQHQAAFKVDVVDTTGCGDVFHGAYMASLVRGEPMDVSIRFASAVAALKARQLGGRSGIPSRTAVEEFLTPGNSEFIF